MLLCTSHQVGVKCRRMRHSDEIDFFEKSEKPRFSACFHQKIILKNKFFLQNQKIKGVCAH